MNNITYVGKNLITFSMHLHSHENWELIYCTGGCGEFVFNDSSMKYNVGDIVIIPPEIPHTNNSEQGFTNIHMNITDATLPFKTPTTATTIF